MNLDANISKQYSEWYANEVCRQITYRGIPIMKYVTDLWNYQQIIHALKPALIIEFGTAHGGSALWFADLLQLVNRAGLVFTVDIETTQINAITRAHPLIRLAKANSSDPQLQARLLNHRENYPGSVFAILDSDHSKAHVLAEMELLRPVLATGDYLVVEDSCINGHPIYAGYGEGPFEAIQQYEQAHPGDYEHDRETEERFGITCATNGYMRRL